MRFLVLPFLLSVLGTFVTLRLFGRSKLWHHHRSLHRIRRPSTRTRCHATGQRGHRLLRSASALLQTYLGNWRRSRCLGPARTPAGAPRLAAASIGLLEDLTGSVSVRMRLAWVATIAVLCSTIEGIADGPHRPALARQQCSPNHSPWRRSS
jgi:hypothetical protein